jgi:N-acetylmuramoyl-L-alanine amidase
MSKAVSILAMLVNFEDTKTNKHRRIFALAIIEQMKFLKIIFSFLFFILCSSSHALSKADSLQRKINRYLDKENALQNYYSIKNDGIYIYADSVSKTKNASEFFLRWSEAENFKKYSPLLLTSELHEILVSNSFSDSIKKVREKRKEEKKNKIRIAIDPGHIAGNMEMGKIENKFIRMKSDSQDISLAEGELTLATALLLKEKLEKEGMEVMLTRSKPGQTSFGKTYTEWLKKDFTKTIDSLSKTNEITIEEKQSLLKTKSPKEIFKKFFREYDLKHRADLINSFNPDATIIIHYNVNEKNTGWKTTTAQNFNMAFIGGSFMEDELDKPENRIEFLRLLVTDDIENSEKLCAAAIESFSKNLHVATAKTSDADYLEKYSLPTGTEGVYARNLTLTRMIHGTILYGETLYMDNTSESRLLNEKADKLQNQRVHQVADAYFEAVKKYFGK